MLSYKILLLLAITSILCSLWLLKPVPGQIKAAEMMNKLRMNMKSYGNHDTVYDNRIIKIKPEWVIDNPPHGLYGEMESPQYIADWLLQNIDKYHAAGIKIAGYITSGYEGRGGGDGYATKWYSLEMNKKLITNMATLDKIDGVFIDECSAFPDANQKAYLKALVDLVHSYGMIAWGNTGVDDFSPALFTEIGFDLIQSTENWQGSAQSLSAVQKQFGSRISVTGFNSAYTAQKAYDLTINAWQRGIRYCYINNVEYTAIAPWFEDYATRLAQVQIQYPVPPLVPASTPSASSPTPTATPATSKSSSTPVSSITPSATPSPTSSSVSVLPPVSPSGSSGGASTVHISGAEGQVPQIQPSESPDNKSEITIIAHPASSIPQSSTAPSSSLAASSRTPLPGKLISPGRECTDQFIPGALNFSDLNKHVVNDSKFPLLMLIAGILLLSSLILILAWRFAR